MRVGCLVLCGLLACDSLDQSAISGVGGVVPEPAPIDVEAVEIVEGERVRVRHILLAWAGASKASPNLRRSREEAWIEAEKALSRLHAGEDFGDLAAELSDDASGDRGGELGTIEVGQMNPVFEAMAFSLEEAAFSPVIETPFGFHILKREPLIEIRIRHILVQWEGARKSDASRSQDEALSRAEEALKRLHQSEEPEAIAQEYSEAPAGLRGGDLGFFQLGQMLPRFEEVTFALEAGEISDIMETELGYHIFIREE